MAICNSGSLGMISAPQGGCSSISAAVCGSAQASSLLSMGIAAELTTPINMTSCWYGYEQSINVEITICWMNNTGGGDGIGGNFTLRCCTGVPVCSRNIPDITPEYVSEDFVDWSVPAGCYHVLWTGVCAYCAGSSVPYSSCWTDTYSSGNDCITSDFSGHNIVVIEIS